MSVQFYLGFIGWKTIILAMVWLNWYRIDVRHKKPVYFFANWSRGVFGFMCLVLMTIDKGFDPATLYTWKHALNPILYIGSSFYLFFDLGLNIKRDKPLDYQGQESGWLDSMGKGYYYTLKAMSAVILLLSLYNLLFQ